MRVAALYIDAQVADWPETRSICSRFEVPAKTVASADEVYADVAAAPDPVRRGKQVLYLTRNKGAFIRQCPGTSHYTCCGYKILHVGTFARVRHCILQSYFTRRCCSIFSITPT
jgi:spore photoproduct lyase